MVKKDNDGVRVFYSSAPILHYSITPAYYYSNTPVLPGLDPLCIDFLHSITLKGKSLYCHDTSC
jgi:hypothetical protein